MGETNEDQMGPAIVDKNEESESAADKAKSANVASQQFKILLLVMMVAQNSSTVLVGRHTRSSVSDDKLYSVNHLITTCELLKVRCLVYIFASYGYILAE